MLQDVFRTEDYICKAHYKSILLVHLLLSSWEAREFLQHSVTAGFTLKRL